MDKKERKWALFTGEGGSGDCDRDSLLVKVNPWDRLATRDKIRVGEKRTRIRIFVLLSNGIWKNEKMNLLEISLYGPPDREGN